MKSKIINLLKMKSKLIIGITSSILVVSLIVVVIIVNNNNYQEEVNSIKEEITKIIIKEDDLKYLKDNNLLSDDLSKRIDKINNSYKEVNKLDLNKLKELKTSITNFDKEVVINLSKYVSDNVNTAKDKVSKLSTNDKEKETKDNLSKELSIKIGTTIKDLIENIKNLKTTISKLEVLVKDIEQRLAAEEKANYINNNKQNTNNSCIYNCDNNIENELTKPDFGKYCESLKPEQSKLIANGHIFICEALSSLKWEIANEYTLDKLKNSGTSEPLLLIRARIINGFIPSINYYQYDYGYGYGESVDEFNLVEIRNKLNEVLQNINNILQNSN